MGLRSPGAVTSGRSVKEIDEQLTNLRKENFNLKLRIYFLEERMGANFNTDKEDAIKKNIELMVRINLLALRVVLKKMNCFRWNLKMLGKIWKINRNCFVRRQKQWKLKRRKRKKRLLLGTKKF